MIVQVETERARSASNLAEIRETDLAKPGNWKWLKSHIKWAARNNKSVTITPR